MNKKRPRPKSRESAKNSSRTLAYSPFRFLSEHRPSAEQIIAAGTIVLATLALVAVVDNRRALERGQRAWLAPFKAEQHHAGSERRAL
jgi:hypothetical protein